MTEVRTRQIKVMTATGVGTLIVTEIIEAGMVLDHNNRKVADMDMPVVTNQADMAAEIVIFVGVAVKDIVVTVDIVVMMGTEETFRMQETTRHDLTRLEMPL